MTNRSASIDTTVFDDLATSVGTAMSEPTFASFQNLINGPHGSVHGRVGGDMCCVPTASYDPIFFLHHANVDRIWATWQLSHPGPLPPTEATWQLQPFNRPFSTAWQTGSDVESTDALGYRYRTWCFIYPPFRLWEVIRIAWPLPLRASFRTARLAFRSDRMQEDAIEIRVFLDQPRATGRTKTVGNPAFAGAFGFIGHGAPDEVETTHCAECAALGHTGEHAHHHAAGGHEAGEHEHDAGHRHGASPHPMTHGGEERFDVELDLSESLRNVEGDDEVAIKLVAVDSDGNEVPAEKVQVDEIELVVE
jgi:tyrosinase